MTHKLDPDDTPAPIEHIIDEDLERFSFHVGKNIERRIDQYLTDRIPYLSARRRAAAH